MNHLSINTAFSADRKQSFDYASPLTASVPDNSLSESKRFSLFLCTMVFKLLGRLPSMDTNSSCYSPTTPTASLTTSETINFRKQFKSSTELIHLITCSVSSVIPLSIVIFALQLIQKIGQSGNRKTQYGSEPYLFAIALIVAQKFVEDCPLGNTCWVKLLNMPVEHINQLEREFLTCIQFNISVSTQEYIQWFKYIQISAKNWDKSLSSPTVIQFKPHNHKISSPPLTPNERLNDTEYNKLDINHMI